MTMIDRQQGELERLIGDKYELLRRIGGGGMAQVFLARHRFHGGYFAIKVLAEYLAQDPRIVARFEQEARTAASLSGCPNIVSIFDIGQGGGLHYLVMQFVTGEDMASCLRREGKVDAECAANIAAQTAEALRWSESKHVVHRDLKPANMLLDVSGRIMILDFGISKITDIADGLTRPGESMGTPYYMSPEQIRGEGCDIRSDLYSLGVILFELLTGARPFDNESSTAIQIAHLSTAPPSLLSYNPALPPAYEQIVQRLLMKNRDERYPSPRELLKDLESVGASSGPCSLRPHIDPMLQQELNGSRRTATAGSPVRSAAASSPPPSAPAPEAAPSWAYANPPATAAESPQAVPPATAREPGPAGRRVWLAPLALVSALLLAAAVVFGWFWLQRPARSIVDAHGAMLLVPAGPFIFGSNAAGSPNPQQTLRLPSFYIDATEVSSREYQRFCQETGRTPPSTPDAAAHPDDPAAGVTFDDATAYAAWAGKRLPTEQEWEKAARGTDGRVYPWGAQPWTVGVPANLQPVNAFAERRSPYGAFNMAGNVWEWTASPFRATELQFVDMRSLLHSDNFSKSWFIIKGGSFSSRGDVFRAYLRRGFPSDQHSPWIGFRCARDISKRALLQ